MSHKGIIYGLVGVIGSGKTYRAEQLLKEAASENRKVIIGDFSEGIRQVLMNIFTGKDKEIDLNGAAYSAWKNNEQRIQIPLSKDNKFLDVVKVDGRKLLQRTGEYLKELAGEDVWARWTKNYVTEKLVSMGLEDSNCCDVIFGSLRFPCEARAVFETAAKTGKQVKIIFCNHQSSLYELNNHISEKFARYFVEFGCKDGEDITELVKEKFL